MYLYCFIATLTYAHTRSPQTELLKDWENIDIPIVKRWLLYVSSGQDPFFLDSHLKKKQDCLSRNLPTHWVRSSCEDTHRPPVHLYASCWRCGSGRMLAGQFSLQLYKVLARFLIQWYRPTEVYGAWNGGHPPADKFGSKDAGFTSGVL